ncbi:hypothetical protein F5144DRAFT_74286 [Chaetomium tenue]|uniref:Uncharacterized protein n=1 Tax=Chaetomium tenue TaxID=1854479 RepID=A0ACB7PPH5_9PEZI|nr:hypothetical protein F5144DRAFT_74286 [Chaetomium globosum]
MGWLVSGRYTRSQTTCGLCGCLGMAGCGLGATLRRHPETGFLAHHICPRPYHIAPGHRVFGCSNCRSHFRWLLYRTPIGGGDDKKSRGIRSFRSRVLVAGSPGCFWSGRQWTGGPNRPDEPVRAWVRTGADFFFSSAVETLCTLYNSSRHHRPGTVYSTGAGTWLDGGRKCFSDTNTLYFNAAGCFIHCIPLTPSIQIIGLCLPAWLLPTEHTQVRGRPLVNLGWMGTQMDAVRLCRQLSPG